jgi:hypothetical protein
MIAESLSQHDEKHVVSTTLTYKGVLVSCEFAHARGIGYSACAPPDSKMGTEVVGTLTHADAPQRGNAQHSTPHPAYVYHALQ